MRPFPESLVERVLADSLDREAWLAARVGKIGGSDAANFAKIESAPRYLKAKLDNPFDGNAYTRHGNDREQQMLAAYRVPQNTLMFRSADNPLHVATPDGIVIGGTGAIVLAQAKTTNHPFWNAKGELAVPPRYLRQMWWEQYVMGADRTLLVWEQHAGFRPTYMEPESTVIHRDEVEIAKLVIIANLVLAGLAAHKQFITEMENA